MKKFEDIMFWYLKGLVVLGSWAIVVLTIGMGVSSGVYAVLLLIFIFLPLAVFVTAELVAEIREEIEDARRYRENH